MIGMVGETYAREITSSRISDAEDADVRGANIGELVHNTRRSPVTSL